MITPACVWLDIDGHEDDCAGGDDATNELDFAMVVDIITDIQRGCDHGRYMWLNDGVFIRVPSRRVNLSAAREDHIARVQLITENTVYHLDRQRAEDQIGDFCGVLFFINE